MNKLRPKRQNWELQLFWNDYFKIVVKRFWTGYSDLAFLVFFLLVIINLMKTSGVLNILVVLTSISLFAACSLVSTVLLKQHFSFATNSLKWSFFVSARIMKTEVKLFLCQFSVLTQDTELDTARLRGINKQKAITLTNHLWLLHLHLIINKFILRKSQKTFSQEIPPCILLTLFSMYILLALYYFIHLSF